MTIGMMSVYDLVAAAYRVKPDQVVDPGWMNTDHWDIDAKIPAAGSAAAVPEMLASLLRDRFHLRMHREMREQKMYALVVSKDGPKLKQAAAAAGRRARRPRYRRQ